jgi:predicted DNA-binding transcriptional regulator YafY
MPRGDQLARQWRLLHLLDRPAGVAVEGAAQELGCTVRTIWRDLRVLHDAGFPIYDEPGADGRRSLWKIREDFKLRLPLKLTLAELTALIMSRDLLGPAAALGPAIRSAFDKISRVLSKDALALIDRMRDTIGVRAIGSKLQAPSAAHVEMIQMALQERRRLDMTYYALSRDEVNRRQVDPYYLAFFDGGFYLIGYCHWRKTERIFAVERIRELKMLAVLFQIPDDFNPVDYLKGSWGIIKGELVTIKVVFSGSVARFIRDRLWHPSQMFHSLPDGRLEMTLRVSDTLEVRRWILGYGTDAEVLKPVSLREALRQQGEALAAKLIPARIGLAQARREPTLRGSARGARAAERLRRGLGP